MIHYYGRTSLARVVVAGTLIVWSLLGSASAALPPQYQRATELQAVINATADSLGEIERVEYLSVDLYRASAGRCHIDVRIVSIERQGNEVVPGPREFDVELGEIVCE